MVNLNTLPLDPALAVHIEYERSGGVDSFYDVTDLEFQDHGVVFKRNEDVGGQVNYYTKFIPYGRLLEVSQTKIVEV